MAASMASADATSQDDDDEVVQELDVYISKALANSLYLLQYPHQPFGSIINEEQCVSARVKPKQHKVELEFALDTRNSSYDRLRGEQLAANADGGGDRTSGQKQTFNSSMMDKQLLTSTKSSSSAEAYAVGILRPGELHLSPVSAVLQMNPSFPYLDQSDKKAKAAEAAMEEDEEVDEPKAVTVRFAHQETDRAKRAREKSFRFIHQKQESEPWVEATFHNFGSELSGVERAMLICPQMDRDESELPKTLPDYFKDLVVDDTDTKTSTKGSREVSMHMLSKLPVQDQIKAVLMSGYQRLPTLRSSWRHCHRSRTRRQSCGFLQQVALLVQGCWVVKSDVLYPKDSFSPKTGVPAETMSRARDFLMFLFTQSRVVVQTKFSDTVRLPVLDVKTLLEDMAKPTPDGWEFMLPYDRDFVSRYPDVVQRQKMLWEAKQQFLSKSFRLTRQEGQDALMQSPPASTKGRQQKKRVRSRTNSTASDGSGSDSGTMTNGKDAPSKVGSSGPSKAANAAKRLTKGSRTPNLSSAKASH
ncbi:hypothetical protein MRX96_022162 [Rhipicephalus microplus]